MAATDQNIPELSRNGLRQFGLVTGGIVAVLFGLFLPWILDHSLPHWPWIVFAALGAWGLIAPMSLRPVYRAWMRLGLVLGRITTPVIMGAAFYLVVTPIAGIWKLAGKDAMARKFDDSESYRVQSRNAPMENLKRPF